jgi:hypothetical protein
MFLLFKISVAKFYWKKNWLKDVINDKSDPAIFTEKIEWNLLFIANFSCKKKINNIFMLI